jgi:hypothetical protein
MKTLEEELEPISDFTEEYPYCGLKEYHIIENNYLHLTIWKHENVSEEIVPEFDDNLTNFLNKIPNADIKLELINCFIEGSEVFFKLKKLVSLRLIGDNIPNLQPLSGREYLEELEILTSSNINLDDIHSLTSIRHIRHNDKVFSPDELARFREVRPAN